MERSDNIEKKYNDRYEKINHLNTQLKKPFNAYMRMGFKTVGALKKSATFIETPLRKLMHIVVQIKMVILSKDKEEIQNLKRFVRKTTKPINYPEFLHKKRLKFKKTGQPYILAEGIHYIYALPGKGKSSLLYDIMEEIRIKTGYGSYINAHLEKPRYDDYEDKWFQYHKYFEVAEHFGKKEYVNRLGETKFKIQQLKKFDKRFHTIGFDELLSWLNHRLNNTGDYLEVFIALIQFLAQRRHRFIKRAYFLNQLDTTDIQLMSAFNYTHEVEVDLDVPYDYWIETGELVLHIKGWWINTYVYAPTGKKNSENKIHIQKHYRKRTANFDYFETLSQSEAYENEVPDDIIEGLYRGK